MKLLAGPEHEGSNFQKAVKATIIKTTDTDLTDAPPRQRLGKVTCPKRHGDFIAAIMNI